MMSSFWNLAHMNKACLEYYLVNYRVQHQPIDDIKTRFEL